MVLLIKYLPGLIHHKCKVRPLMPNSEKAVKGKEAWDQMVQLGVVEKVDPNAKTSWGSPLHLVPKPDNTMRPCSDFRQLNAKTDPDGYPIPALKSFTHKLHNARVFSKVDLFSAFHNIVIEPSDVEKTTTLTPWGGLRLQARRVWFVGGAQHLHEVG